MIGEGNIIKKGPAIYIANHPNALLDPLLIGVSLPRKVFFLAGANFFGKGFRSYLFKEHFNMVPVYRPWLAKGESVSNDEMFLDCYKALSAGKCIVLFPEASSKTVSKIREVKTGAIRIKFGAEEYANNKIEVPIIPVGLNYSNAHEFQSRVIVNFKEKIHFTSNEFNNSDELRSMSEEMKVALENAIVRIENDDNQDLVKCINRLYVDQLRKEDGHSYKDLQANLTFLNQIANAVAYFEKENPAKAVELSGRIRGYFETLKENGLSDDSVSDSNKLKPGVLRIVFLLLGLPFAFSGLVLNVIPYKTVSGLFRSKISRLINNEDENAAFDHAFTSTLIFGSGIIIFLIWNILISVLTGILFSHWLAGLVLFLLYFPLLRFSLYYFRFGLYTVKFFKNKLRSRRNNLLFNKLQNERAEILSELKDLHEYYRNH